MKYAEFRRMIKDMNYKLEETETLIYVRKKLTNQPIAYVSKEKRFTFIVYAAFGELNQSDQEELFYLVTELSKKPIEDREEEKQYRLKFENNLKEIYVLFDELKSDWDYYSNGKFIGQKSRKAIFTESELKKIDETGFVREEVTE